MTVNCVCSLVVFLEDRRLCRERSGCDVYVLLRKRTETRLQSKCFVPSCVLREGVENVLQVCCRQVVNFLGGDKLPTLIVYCACRNIRLNIGSG